MDKKAKNIIINFIKKEFPIKRIKNNRNKWMRAIVVPQGYIRKERKIYPLHSRSHLNQVLISSDIIETVSYVFGFDQNKIKPIVMSYIKSIRI
jgi:hypothetical protein